MCLMFALLDRLFSKEIHIQQNKQCKHHIKGTKKSLQTLRNSVRFKWDIYKPVHCILNWCQLHQYHISFIMRKQETIHLTSFHSQLKKLLLNFSDYFIWNLSQSHVRLCIIINHSLSLYQCREHKPTFQIINNWWLKY